MEEKSWIRRRTIAKKKGRSTLRLAWDRSWRWAGLVAVFTTAYLWWKISNLSTRTIEMDTPSKSMSKSDAASGDRKGSVAFVFTVHGAITYFHNALNSLQLCTAPKPGQDFKIFVADDCIEGSESEQIKGILREVRWPSKQIQLGSRRLGYTKAVNSGLRAAWQEGYEILIALNSDLIFTPHWLQPLENALLQSQDVGVAGPISNAASYQSVPELTTPQGKWHTNPFPEGWEENDMAMLAFLLGDCGLLPLPILNGFVLAIHRRTVEKVGWMDEDLFPYGYGEENDYAMRVQKAGLKLVVSSMSYVYHHKTKSFTELERKKFAHEAKSVLYRSVGKELAAAEDILSSCQSLSKLRDRFRGHMNKDPSLFKAPFSVIFILNPIMKSRQFMLRGGWISVVQEAMGLAQSGIYARVAVQDWTLPFFQTNFPRAHNLFTSFRSHRSEGVALELAGQSLAFNFLVATHFSTVEIVARLSEFYPNSVKGYYVQDIEENFKEAGTASVSSTFDVMKDGFIFAKTSFLQQKLFQYYGAHVQLIPPTVDLDLFASQEEIPEAINTFDGVMHICAMVRIITPRRNPLQTLQILASILKESSPPQIKATVFGSSVKEVEYFLARGGESIDLMKGILFMGSISRQSVAQLLQTCTFFLDFSQWQAFGRGGLEAMAAGSIPLLPKVGGASTYATHGVNAILLDTSDTSHGVEAIRRLLSGKHDLYKMRQAALKTSRMFSIEQSGNITAQMFQTYLQNWIPRRMHQCSLRRLSCSNA